MNVKVGDWSFYNQSYEVTLDISGRSIESQWGSGKYPG